MTEDGSNTRLHSEDQRREIDSHLAGITEYDHKLDEHINRTIAFLRTHHKLNTGFSGRVSKSCFKSGIYCVAKESTNLIIPI